MRDAQNITFDVTGQTVYFDAPEGRPSSVASVGVFAWDMADDDTAEAAVGSGSVETNPATTLDGNAGASQSNPRNIPLTATTGIAKERRYLITGAASLQEWVEVESITSADSVTAKHPLHNDYASGASFQSTRIQATIDPTWVADDSNLIANTNGNPMYRVRWVYVVGGVTYVADTYFNLVRYAARHGVLPQDVEAMVPGWLDALPLDHYTDQGRRLIDDAYRAVRIDLRQIDLSANAVAESEIVDELVRYKTVLLTERTRFLNSTSGDQTRVAEVDRWYSERLNSLVRVVSRVPVRDTSGAAAPTVSVGISRR